MWGVANLCWGVATPIELATFLLVAYLQNPFRAKDAERLKSFKSYLLGGYEDKESLTKAMLEKYPEKSAKKIRQSIEAHAAFVEQAVDSTIILSSLVKKKKQQYEYPIYFGDDWVEFWERSPDDRVSMVFSDEEMEKLKELEEDDAKMKINN